MQSAIDGFSTAMEAAGLPPPPTIEADGSLHRFNTSGKRGDDSGWYVLHPDGIAAGVFGCWRNGWSQTWSSKPDTAMTQAERDAQRQPPTVPGVRPPARREPLGLRQLETSSRLHPPGRRRAAAWAGGTAPTLPRIQGAHAMTKKAQTPAVQNGNTDPNTLELHKDPTQTDTAQIAAMALGSVAANAMTARTFAKGTFGTLDVTECVLTLKKRVDTTHGGDLKHAESTLTAQAATLDAIFNEMARRAALNMGEYMDATERYMRLALKAQGQCRATLETLAAIKNPPVIFAKQANIAHGPQQVNNDGFPSSTRTRACARKAETTPDELLEGPQHGSTNMDDRAATTPARGHPTVEALEPIHRPRKSRRKGSGSA